MCDDPPMASKAVLGGIAAAGIALGLVAYHVQVDNLGPYTANSRSMAIVAVAWAFLFSGLIAWSRRPRNRMGPLMVATGFAFLLRQLRYSHDGALFTVFFLLGELAYALIAHVTLAYPSGRITDRIERAFVKTAYGVAIVFPLLTLLFYDATKPKPLRFFDPTARESLFLVAGSAGAVEGIQDAFVVVAYGVMPALFVTLIARKLIMASSRGRRVLAPLLVAAVAVALRAIFECISAFAGRPDGVAYEHVFFWQIAAQIALPIALLAGLLRARLARASVGDLVMALERTPPTGLRDALARTLGDPTLEIAFWIPERQEYVDPLGFPVALPLPGSRQTVTRLEHKGEPFAAFAHDPTLSEEPRLVQAAGAAAHMALENVRLQAEVRAQLVEVEESRARIVAAGGEERRRIERDLHDGAQQRLVALALELRSAQRKLGATSDPEVERLLESAVSELQVAVEELRELAHGVHPTILAQEGLSGALDALAARTPLPVTLRTAFEGRLPPEVEATAYFVACEALTNAVKHGRATQATISATLPDGVLRRRGGGRRRRRGRAAERVRAPWARRPRRGERRSPDRREPDRWGNARRRGDPLRVVIADDSVLLREGLARVLADGGFEVVAQAGDASGLMHAVAENEPDVAIVDVRMPPTHTDEGARAAKEIRKMHPDVGVLVLSQVVEAGHALELLSERPEGFGYLLKDRVLEIDEFLESVRRVARGGTAVDRRSSRSSWAAGATPTARGSITARAGSAGADGRGPLQPRDSLAST